MAGTAYAAPLRLCYEDVAQAPWTMPDGTGLSFILLKQVASMTGEQFQFFARPWRRCLEELKQGRMDGLIGAADVPERRSFMLPPMLPDGRANPAASLNPDAAYVYLRAGSAASWNGKELNAPRHEVVGQRGYMVTDLLRQRGFRVVDSIKSAEDGLRLLAAGGADVAVLQGHVSQMLVRNDPRFKGKVIEAKLPYLVIDSYLVFNRQLYQHQSARIDAIWAALASARGSVEYQKIESQQLEQVEASP